MSFRDFQFPDVCDQLGYRLKQEMLFPNIVPRQLSPAAVSKVEGGLLLSQRQNNEKARSEFVIAPLLHELWDQSGRSFGLLSGCELNVDASKGLNGVCDFLLARDPLVFKLTAPVLALVEAKNENVWNGFAQCVATMIAASIYNERAGTPVETLYGASTTGRDWKFFRLTGKIVAIDEVEYALIKEIDLIAGILGGMVGLK